MTDEITIMDYIAVLKKVWWKAALLSLAAGLATFLWLMLQPDIYQSKAVITPATETGKATTALGAFSMLGIDIGGMPKTGELETLFNSDELTVRVFRKYDLWPTLLGDGIDPATGMKKTGWLDNVFGKKEEPKPPGDWDAIRLAKGFLKVAVKKGDTILITVETRSPEGSARVLKCYLDEAKSRMQEEALDRAIKNNRFITDQIARTVDTLTRDRLYTLYGQEVEREMMARNREQFGFRIVDPPRVPDKKFRPMRAKSAVIATVLSFFPFCFLLIVFGKKTPGTDS